MMKPRFNEILRSVVAMRARPTVAALFAGSLLLLSGCGGQPQPRAYVSQLDGSDSLAIRMGQWTLTRYHSPRLGFDINYPSYLERQDLPEEAGPQEVFMMDDVSLSVVVDSLGGMMRSPGQMMMGMGADLVDVGDDFSIHEGADYDWDYYAKVIEPDTFRLVTVMLRYAPDHADAVEQLKEWVREFQVK